MAVFDITSRIISWGKNDMLAIRDWLSKNVGEFYGKGEDPIIFIGLGWEIGILRERDEEQEHTLVSWYVDITDEEKSIMYALVWS